jgi:acetyltransferase-like isoleucine patch superfamily enzyme
MTFFTCQEVSKLGLAHVGKDVRISRLASLHNPAGISVGDHARIDDFCVLSAGEGGIEIGQHVHLAVFVSLMGKGKIALGDFSGMSSRVSVYSSNDDYSGQYMTNPTLPPQFTNVTSGPVSIGRHAIVGSGAIIMPNVSIGEGAAIGALSLVRDDCEPFGIYVGVPARYVTQRRRELLEIEHLLQSTASP